MVYCSKRLDNVLDNGLLETVIIVENESQYHITIITMKPLNRYSMTIIEVMRLIMPGLIRRHNGIQ